MSDSYMKDIVYDLIESKLRIKELEDKLALIEIKNKELTTANTELTSEVDKWKTQIVAYMNDYSNMYNKSDKTIDDSEKVIANTVVNTEVDNNVEDNIDDDNKKSRSEYMKEYMRNKRKQKKEELKQIIVNKK